MLDFPVEFASAAASPAVNQLHMDPAATVGERVLSRQRRMNFFDLANLLDGDGNLQNEMMVFAFAATMLSTIPILLGNEFDVNVGLRKRKRRQAGPYMTPDEDDDTSSSYVSYYYSPEMDSGDPPAFFSSSTYKRLMTSPPGTDVFRIHESDTEDPPHSPPEQASTGASGHQASLTNLLKDLLVWSKDKVKNKHLLPVLINLGWDRYQGNTNPADKLVKAALTKWKKYWYN